MKNSLIIALLLSSCRIFSQIEGLHVGGRFGLGESSMTGGGIQNANRKLAISGGIAANYQFTKMIGLNADFLLTSVGAKANGYTTDGSVFGEQRYMYKERFDLVNVEVPVTGQLMFWMGDLFFKAYSGPGMNFNLMAVQTRDYENENYNNSNGFINKPLDDSRNIYYSMVYGLGIGAMSKSDQIYFLDLRINKGLSPIGTMNNQKAYVNYYCITGGYIF